MFLIPVAVMALPKPSAGREMGSDAVIGLTTMINHYTGPIFVMLQLYSMLKLVDVPANPGIMSLAYLRLQVLCSAALGTRWLLRLGAPSWAGQYASPSLWYQWGSVPFGSFLHAIASAILLPRAAFIDAAQIKQE